MGLIMMENAKKKLQRFSYATHSTQGNSLSSLSDYEMVLHGYVEPCRHAAVILMPHTAVPTKTTKTTDGSPGRCFASTTCSYPEFSLLSTKNPRDPGSPSENGFMEPKYYTTMHFGDEDGHPKKIIWEYDWIPTRWALFSYK